MDLDRLDEFLKPLYQDLDGVSRAGEVARVAAIARELVPSPSRELELLVRFPTLASWLQRVGNASRTALNTGLGEGELRRVAASAKRLDAPSSEAERAVAAALLIDGAGVRGLAERFSRARREGRSVVEVAREVLGDQSEPEWLSEAARLRLAERRSARDAFCRAVLEEAGEETALGA